jgi:hypothetical protein
MLKTSVRHGWWIITAQRRNQLTEMVGAPEGITASLFRDTFLAHGAVHVVCLEQWLLGGNSTIVSWLGADLRALQTDILSQLQRMCS